MPAPIHGKKLELADIEGFVQSKEYEGIHLDYKLKLSKSSGPPSPASEDNEYKIAADICAFANAYGGHIVIGIEEERVPPPEAVSKARPKKTDRAKEAQPLDDADAVEWLAWLERIIRLRVAPVPTAEAYRVRSGEDGKVFLVVTVWRTDNGPYCYTDQDGIVRFYRRTESGNDHMAYDEIAEWFQRSQSLETRIRERFMESYRAATGANNQSSPFMLVQITPTSHFGRRLLSPAAAINPPDVDFFGTDFLRLEAIRTDLKGWRMRPRFHDGTEGWGDHSTVSLRLHKDGGLELLLRFRFNDGAYCITETDHGGKTHSCFSMQFVGKELERVLPLLMQWLDKLYTDSEYLLHFGLWNLQDHAIASENSGHRRMRHSWPTLMDRVCVFEPISVFRGDDIAAAIGAAARHIHHDCLYAFGSKPQPTQSSR